MQTANATVLDEEEYSEAIQRIIQQNFFPELPRIKWEVELLEAQQAQDIVRINRAQMELQQFQRNDCHGNVGGEDSGQAPPNNRNWEDNQQEPENKEEKPSLDDFLANYTSEDNASFSLLFQKQLKKHQEKVNRFLGELNATTVAALQEGQQTPALAAGSSSKQLILAESPSSATSSSNKKHNHFNSLMFYPTIDPSINETRPNVDSAGNLISLAPPKQIIHENTRLAQTMLDRQSVITGGSNLSSQLQKPEDLIWGLHGLSEDFIIQKLKQERKRNGTFDLDTLLSQDDPSSLMASDNDISVSGYNMVQAPSPMPGAANQTPIITWGDVEATPLRLESKFKIPATPKREELRNRLADDAVKRMRGHYTRRPIVTPTTTTPMMTPPVAGAGGSTPSSSSSSSFSSRLEALSPAARRLASHVVRGVGASPMHLGTTPINVSTGRWRSGAVTPRSRSVAEQQRPQRDDERASKKPNLRREIQQNGANSLTDNLLHW